MDLWQKRWISGVFFFGVAVLVGAGLGRQSWHGAIYLTNTSFTSNLRNPAAIHRDLDFTKLDGSELITGSQSRLVTSARVLLQPGQMGIELGHFVTRDDQGNRQLACEFYDRVRFKFEAEGVATGGERPVMEIEGPCRTGSDVTRIEAVWVPVAKILSERPTDMDLTFPDNEGVKFKFENMNGEWPNRWRLQNLRVFNDAEKTRSISMSAEDLHRIGGKPLVLAWPSKDHLPTSAD